MKRGGAFLLDEVQQEIFTREQFGDEQKEIYEMVKSFATEQILPHKEELKKPNKELTMQLMHQAGELGLCKIDIPEQYGGLGMDKISSAIVAEALAASQCASWAVTLGAHMGIGTLPIVFYGTEEQKQKYLPGLGSCKVMGAYCLTEPGAGSDALDLKTTAILSEDKKYFTLNGVKQFITNGAWAELFIVFAKINGTEFTAFIVEKGFPGISIGNEEEKMGIKGSSTTNITFEDCIVPVENLLGKPGKGHLIAFNILNIGRFKLGAADLGGCKVCITLATKYALERKQFGQPIAYFDSIRSKMASMVVRTFNLDSSVYRTIGMMEEKISTLDTSKPDYNLKMGDALEEYAIEASICKIYGSESLGIVSDHGIQIYGGYGFTEEYPMAAMARNTRIDRIFEGTNEINRMVIYAYYLKKALMEDLPFRDQLKYWHKLKIVENGSLAWELNALDAARRVTLRCFDQAVFLYGQDLRNEQVAGEALADMIIGYFASSSAINRILQIKKEAMEPSLRAIARLSVVYFLKEFTGLFHMLKPTLYSKVDWEKDSKGFSNLFKYFDIPFDPVGEIRVLTDDLYHHNQYRY